MIKPLQSITLKNEDGEDTTYVVASAPAIVETTEPASVASFSDGAEGLPVSSLIADINPVQNLNGQSAPYPAGGGKNKVGLNTSPAHEKTYHNVTQASGGSDNSITLTSNDVTYACMRLFYTLPAGTYTISFEATSSDSYTPVVSVYNYSTSLLIPGWSNITGDGNSATLSEETTLDIRFFATTSPKAVRTVTFKNFQLESGSTKTSFAPYSNICPITGWTGMNVVRNGFNQWDEEWESGGLDVTGNPIPATQIRSKNYIPVVGGITYFIKSPYTSGIGIYQYDADKNYITRQFVADNTLTLNANTRYLKFRTSDGVTTYNHDISINYPSTDHNYHAYTGTTYPISWADEAGTVYGGTLDVTNGLLTVTHELKAISEFSWTQHPTNPIVFYTTVSGKAVGSFNIMSDAFSVTTSSVASMIAGTMCGFTSNAVVYIAANSTDPTDFVNDYGTNQLLYELATPTTYQLTPQAVLTILGQNNILADTGDVEVAYCADTKMYIDKMIAAL